MSARVAAPVAALTRRSALQALASLLGALVAPVGAPALAQSRRPVLNFAIAGGWYHGLERVRDAIAPGDVLRLVAEPDNPYDRFAVAVYRGDLKLGYVPRAANEPLARLLAEGARIEADVTRMIEARRPAGLSEKLAFTSFREGDPVVQATLVEA